MVSELKLELAWDRAAKPLNQESEHYLRVRIIPEAARSGGLPLRIALALDTSRSMEEDNRLTHACEACLAAAGRLSTRDHFSLAGYAKEVTELARDNRGGPMATGKLALSLGKLKAKGVTRTDLALHWLTTALAGGNSDTAKVAVLITDGHATDDMGRALGDLSSIVGQAQNLGRCGARLYTVGLGDAEGFNTAFLDTLSSTGQGEFVYADQVEVLATKLRALFAKIKHLGTCDSSLTATCCAKVRIAAACRLRPVFAPLKAEPAGNDQVTIQTGALLVNEPSGFLLKVVVPSAHFGAKQEKRRVIKLTAAAGSASAEAEAELMYTVAYSELRELAADVHTDRRLWEMNTFASRLQDAPSTNQTVALLESLEQAAAEAGADATATSARGELDNMRKTGVLTKHNATTLLTKAREEGSAHE